MNRRDFLEYLLDTAMVATFVPTGLVLPSPVIKLPERWRYEEGVPTISAVSEAGRIVGCQRLRGFEWSEIDADGNRHMYAESAFWGVGMIHGTRRGDVPIRNAILSVPWVDGARFEHRLQDNQFYVGPADTLEWRSPLPEETDGPLGWLHVNDHDGYRVTQGAPSRGTGTTKLRDYR